MDELVFADIAGHTVIDVEAAREAGADSGAAPGPGEAFRDAGSGDDVRGAAPRN